MGSLLLNILFVSFGAAVGILGGWFLRGGSPPPPDESAPVPDIARNKGLAHMETLMGRLHQLTSSVAADIGAHNSRVKEINHELVQGADVVSMVAQLMGANEKMQAQLQSAEKRLHSQAKEIESHVKEARTDALTQLANRRAFDDEIRHCVEAKRASDTPFCLMMVDVDHFKRINDTYGHQAGDEVLKKVARVLRREFGGDDVICRYGGEEFAIIFRGQSLEEVLPRAEKGRAAIADERMEYENAELKVTASGGVAEAAPDETVEQLIKRADNAMYVSKSNGRNRGYWHDGITSFAIQANKAKKAAAARPARAPAPVNDQPSGSTAVFQLQDNNQPKERTQSLERIAGLSDRETLCKDLDRRLSEFQRRGTPASLLLIEIDEFAGLVDDYGDKTAELALRAAAQVVKVSKRDMDHAARFDTAIIGILVPATELVGAQVIAERIRVSLEECKIPAFGDPLQVTVSLGVTCTQRGDDLETIFGRATHALREARSTGGNRVCAAGETAQVS